MLIVFLSSRISPFTSTVIFFDRSPVATAVVTSAMLRTCAVRFDAIEFTDSVRSFHVPATPCTSAWPPSCPSVPTSRATRVTSDANERSWSTIVLIVFLSSRISPFTSTVIFFDRSPVATALVTSAMLRTCAVRFDAIEFTESVRSFHVPATPFTSAWPPRLPSVPTSRATRVTSDANDESWSTIVLIVFLSSRISPFTSTVIFFERSPDATALVTSAMLRTWPVRFDAIEFTESVRSFHVPDTPSTRAWPPSLPSVPTSRATRVTSEANERSWSTIVLIVFLSSRNSPLTSTVIFLRQVAGRHGGRHVGDVAHLGGQVAGHRVHRVGEVLPGAGHALHLRLAAELAFGADLARDARHFRGERAELVHHLVDGLRRAQELALQRLAVDLERHRLRQVALRDRADHARGFAGRMHEVVDQLVDRVDRVAPEAGDVAERAALAELSLLADDVRQALELVRHPLVALDDLVERVGDASGHAGPFDRQAAPTRRRASAR